MAGGRELATPFGVLYSTNITPDKETGLGGYSFAQFDRAMRKGRGGGRPQPLPGHALPPPTPR